MSERDLETLAGLYAEWEHGDFGRDDAFAPDMEFVYSESFPEPGVHRGREAVREGWKRWLLEWADVTVVPERYIEAGEKILVEILIRGRGRTSGALVDGPGANLWTFKDGLATRLELFADRAEARRAAGVPEA